MDLMADIYHLYLDESETHDTDARGKWLNKAFCIAGVIAKSEFHGNILTAELNTIKRNIWGSIAIEDNYILHEKDIRFVQNKHNKYKLNQVDSKYHIFKHNRCSSLLYKGLENMLNHAEVTVIGGCIVEDEIHRHFDKAIFTEKSLIIMQVVLENFCHFLQANNGMGLKWDPI